MTAWNLIAQFRLSTMDLDRWLCNPVIERIGRDGGRGWCVSAGPCGCFLGWSAIGEHERHLRLGDLGHGLLGEEAPSLELTFLLLLQ